MSGSAHISDLTFEFVDGSTWAMVRSHFDIKSFGVNAYVAAEPGTEVIGEHDELGDDSGKHEELYFVSSGHTTFTVNGDEIDAPTGTFVFVRDPAAKRKAVAHEAGTTVLIVSIDPNGGVLDVEVERSSGNRNLDREAVKAARRWRFNPEVRDGKKIASRVRVPVEFKLN
jgi:TonB family protein